MKDVADDLALIVRNAIAYIKELEAELARCKQVCAATAEAWREEAALAEPVQEPVAWLHTDPDNPRVKFLVWRENEPAYRGVWIKTPLYAAPPQRKPLTEEEIVTMYAECPTSDNDMIEFARAIEQAHGIGGQP